MFEGSVLWRDYEIEPNVNLECVFKLRYLGDTLGAGGCVKAARARVRCASANIEVSSSVLTAHGASYHNY